MTNHKNLIAAIQAGDIIKPWLILGPVYQDLSASVQGLTLFEKPGAVVGRAAMAEIVQDAQPILAATPRESDEVTFREMTARWNLVRRPEKYLSWGTYNISNHLGATFLSSVITPDEPGVQRWRLLAGISLRAVVSINGEVVYDTEPHPVEREYGEFIYNFEAELRPGENVVTVGLFRLGRMAQVGCWLEVLDSDVQARVLLAANMSTEERSRIETELTGLRLTQDIFYPDQPITLTLTQPLAGRMKTQLLSDETDAGHGDTPTIIAEINHDGNTSMQESDVVTLCPADSLDDGQYQIRCTWETDDGTPVTATTFDIRKVTPPPSLPGYERMDERKQIALELYADNVWLSHARPDIWREVARYALGQYERVDEAKIADTCAFIAARKDCADFVIQGVLRLMAWECEQPRLSPQINAMMKDTILGFKYWVDEPGDTVMYMGSENHRLLFHVAEWMAGQLFPTEEFTNSRQRGLYHATKGRMYITEWLRQRGRFGFDEWHSNSYYPICIAPLLNVYDFAIYEDDKLRQMAGAVLDYMFFNLAADSFNGIFGTTHGRSYGVNIKYPDLEGTTTTCWQLFGVGSMVKGSSGMSPVLLASSKYRLPQILANIATDRQTVVESRQRQGILPGTAPHANFCVYRTPDYMLSGLQDHRKGEIEPSTHVAQVTLNNKVVIFWSCPLTSGEGSGLRPDYWSGQITLPRVIQHRNVMSLTWRLSEFAWMSHCFFEQERMDKVQFDGNWAFARVGKGYVGIYSQNGMLVGDYGQYAGRELVCNAAENTWLVECGREADWGSFAAFVDALKAARIEVDGSAITYESPSVGEFVTGWEATPTIGGEPIQLERYPLVDSPWAHADFGSGELSIRYGDEIYEIWFNQ